MMFTAVASSMLSVRAWYRSGITATQTATEVIKRTAEPRVERGHLFLRLRACSGNWECSGRPKPCIDEPRAGSSGHQSPSPHSGTQRDSSRPPPVRSPTLGSWHAEPSTDLHDMGERYSPNAKGNFQFDRMITGWRNRPVLDLRLKK
uniref:Putative membrane transport protein n=1 Tax=Aplysina aerophoba bacterial symbiont clone AANRPS TaxID=1042317 RepID=F8S303_9BACT|nr:putative membrane transport protein [Aplysina aerophoba bacterial symbiont clone AANRPS]